VRREKVAHAADYHILISGLTHGTGRAICRLFTDIDKIKEGWGFDDHDGQKVIAWSEQSPPRAHERSTRSRQ
jgi:hypothetical protein